MFPTQSDTSRKLELIFCPIFRLTRRKHVYSSVKTEMMRNNPSMLVLWTCLFLCSGSTNPRSLFDLSPCEYVSIMDAGSQLGRHVASATTPDPNLISECRNRMVQDLKNGQFFFDIPQTVAIGPDAVRMWTRLVAFLSDGLGVMLPCQPTEIVPLRNANTRNMGGIGLDATTLFVPADGPLMQEVVECYHVRNPNKFYVSGFMNLLKPLLIVFNINTPEGRVHMYRAYHALNSVIRTGFSDFGNIVPKLWYERIRDSIPNTGPTDRWFDHLLLKAITHTPVPEVPLRRLAQIFFVFGRDGAIMTYRRIAIIILQLVKSKTKNAYPIEIEASGPLNAEIDVENNVFGHLNLPEFLNQITNDIVDYMYIDRSLNDGIGSLLPKLNSPEMIDWGMRSNVFESSETMAYAAFVRHKFFGKREALSTNTLVKPLFPSSAHQVFNGLKKFQNAERSFTDPNSSSYAKFRGDIRQDVCRMPNKPMGLPRSFTDDNLQKLSRVTIPTSGVTREEFDQLIASIDGEIKNRFMNGLTCGDGGPPSPFLSDPFAWIWIKLSAVLFFEFNIEYYQGTSGILGGIIDMYNGVDFNFAIEILSGALPGVFLINDEIPIDVFVKPTRDILAPSEFPNGVEIGEVQGTILKTFEEYFAVGGIIGGDPAHPPPAPVPPQQYSQTHTQYLFSHIYNCGVTANIASVLALVRRLGGNENLKTIVALANHATANGYGDEQFRTSLFRVYMARIFDLYNVVLFRDTLEGDLAKYPVYETIMYNGGNPAYASLRVTPDRSEVFTCGPTSYIRIRANTGCAETYTFENNIIWDMIGEIRDDANLMRRFNTDMLCYDYIGGKNPHSFQKHLSTALSKEIVISTTRTVKPFRRLFVANRFLVEHLLDLDEKRSAIDCIGTGSSGNAVGHFTQITCVFTIGTHSIVTNRKIKKECKMAWTKDDDQKHTKKIRRFCPIIGANYIRLQQAAYEAKLDEFMQMEPIMQPQNYTSQPSGEEFSVALVGPGGSHLRISNPDETVVEIWPVQANLYSRISNIRFMDKVVTEALIGRDYVPGLYDRDVPGEEPGSEFNNYYVFNSRDTVFSMVDGDLNSEGFLAWYQRMDENRGNRAIIACRFLDRFDMTRVITLYRFFAKLENGAYIPNISERIIKHCHKAGALWYNFEKTIKRLADKPQKYRSSTGFETNNPIIDYLPGDYGEYGSVMVEYRRPPVHVSPHDSVGGFKISKECSIEFEVHGGGHSIEAWKHASGYFRDVCRKASPGRPGSLLVIEISPAVFYCDNEIVSIRCELIAGAVAPSAAPGTMPERMIITHISPKELENNFTQSLRCDKSWYNRQSSWEQAYNQAIRQHCRSLAADLITAVREYVPPSAPPLT